ncbi:hypothetical protein ACFC0M_24865 [Streptomyces sp. NPDC056149]|uniref:hypothetical protein n=1 Tax=unclassified Streptomyces TaxID=2593676 RepID=UPI0023818F36|nr:hypothetical protein [Streptomyces sp. WZ-12]
MFSGKKIAAASALLGGLASASVIATPANAVAANGLCSRDVQGNVTCLQRSTGTNQDGGYTLNQSQTCQPTSPVTLPTHGILNPGSAQIGPAITCSNTAPIPGDQMNGMN